jgi:hypothetical protein
MAFHPQTFLPAPLFPVENSKGTNERLAILIGKHLVKFILIFGSPRIIIPGL